MQRRYTDRDSKFGLRSVYDQLFSKIIYIDNIVAKEFTWLWNLCPNWDYLYIQTTSKPNFEIVWLYTERNPKFGFGRRKSSRNLPIANSPILEIWGRFRSANYLASTPPNSQILNHDRYRATCKTHIWTFQTLNIPSFDIPILECRTCRLSLTL